MPIATVNGLELYYEEAGTGFPLVWNHEFAGDVRMRNWTITPSHYLNNQLDTVWLAD
jgi:hypothetical protein